MKYPEFVADIEKITGDKLPANTRRGKPPVRSPMEWAPRDFDSIQYASGGLTVYSKDCWGWGKTKEFAVPAMIQSQYIGGRTGGNCYNDNEPYFEETYEKITEVWDELDDVIEHYMPDISYLKHKKIMRLVNHTEYSQGEYYGNSSDYKIQIIIIKDLWNFFRKQEVFDA